jgi:tetratricopeptide (TPR) repeat protein
VGKTRREFQDGEIIFAEGDGASAAYVLVEGTVELLQNTDAGPTTLAFVQAGETFGDDAARAGRAHAATARTIGPVTVEVVSRRELTGEAGADGDVFGPLRGLLDRFGGLGDLFKPPAAPAEGAPPPPPMPAAGGGLFARLFGGTKRLDVRVAGFKGGDPALPRQLAQLLGRHAAVRARTLKTTIDAGQLAREADENAPVELVDPAPAEIAARHLTAAAAAARAAALKAGADVLVWGAVPDPGPTLTLYFTAAQPEDEDRPALFADVVGLKVPATLDPAWAPLLHAVVLAAANPADDAVKAQIAQVLPQAMDAARDMINSPPLDATTDEQAASRLAFANVVALSAVLHGSGHLFAQAADLYRAALAVLDKETRPLEWALAQRNLGMALAGVADAGGDEMTPELTAEAALDGAVDALRASAQVLSPKVLAPIWAAAQNRIGLALYKLDATSEDADILKHALAAYQAALQVFSQSVQPLRWAEVMHNLAQAAQVLGEQLKNQELLQKAVDACRAALKVRRLETQPLAWAATQNNLGSALFLLGRTLKEREALEQAADAFAQVRDFHSQAGNANAAAIAGRNFAHVEKTLAALDKNARPGKPPRMKWEPPEEPVEPPAETRPDDDASPGGDEPKAE